MDKPRHLLPEQSEGPQHPVPHLPHEHLHGHEQVQSQGQQSQQEAYDQQQHLQHLQPSHQDHSTGDGGQVALPNGGIADWPAFDGQEETEVTQPAIEQPSSQGQRRQKRKSRSQDVVSEGSASQNTSLR